MPELEIGLADVSELNFDQSFLQCNGQCYAPVHNTRNNTKSQIQNNMVLPSKVWEDFFQKKLLMRGQ